MIRRIEEADVEGVGNKARRLGRLRRAKPTLFRVAPGVVLTGESIHDRGSPELESALGEIGPGPFAVRSCGLEEDAAESSEAGRYHSELNVLEQDVPEAVALVRQSFGEDEQKAGVLIQPMVDADLAGVLFTRSPENSGLAACEFAGGGADDVVSGRVEPRRVDFGRWSGRPYPEPEAEVAQVLRRVFLVGMVVEDAIGTPQDIEWAWDSRRKSVTVLQSRDVTARISGSETAREQERVAKLLLESRLGRAGRPAFHHAAVREVVINPTPLTQSLVERLYAPTGALGAGFRILGLPVPELRVPYVTSLFGKLYADVDVERQLFGLRLRRLWAGRRLRRRLQRDRLKMLAWLEAEIEAMMPPTERAQDDSARAAARALVARAADFVERVYPTAYTTTLSAQISGDEGRPGTGATSRFLGDLSRLHHSGRMEPFLERWGHRSANDYELSEPRFSEAPERAREFAARFATLAWEPAEAEPNFVTLKERAKDRAVRCLGPVRAAALALESKLGLDEGEAFYLRLEDVQSMADGRLDVAEAARLVARRRRAEQEWSGIDLGDAVSLVEIERLSAGRDTADRLRGRMIAAREPFEGTARHAAGLKPTDLSPDDVLVTRFLEPELVGLFPACRGCIADMGGALSHAAIVAREQGFPVLVLAGSSTTIHDGDGVRVEADGAVTITAQQRGTASPLTAARHR